VVDAVGIIGGGRDLRIVYGWIVRINPGAARQSRSFVVDRKPQY
jgi:hypothetical protein